MINLILEKAFDHIQNWAKFWFGLIFIGSILNAFIEKSSFFQIIPNVTFWAFALGGLIGLVAKFRGAWL